MKRKFLLCLSLPLMVVGAAVGVVVGTILVCMEAR